MVVVRVRADDHVKPAYRHQSGAGRIQDDLGVGGAPSAVDQEPVVAVSAEKRVAAGDTDRDQPRTRWSRHLAL
jgi:hypothetical protein